MVSVTLKEKGGALTPAEGDGGSPAICSLLCSLCSFLATDLHIITVRCVEPLVAALVCGHKVFPWRWIAIRTFHLKFSLNQKYDGGELKRVFQLKIGPFY